MGEGAGKTMTVHSVADAVRGKVSERIKSEFVDLIPDDVWDGMIRSEINRFTKPGESTYGRSGKPELQQIIHDEIEARFKEQVEAEFKKPEWRVQFGGSTGKEGASEMLKKVMVECAPEMFASMMGTMAQEIVFKIQQEMANRIG